MKFKRTVILLTVLVAMGLMLGASAAQAADVIFVEGTTVAIEVRNLDVDGTLYTVSFRVGTAAVDVYGPFDQATFTFNDTASANEALDALIAALNAAGATAIAQETQGETFFHIGYGTFLSDIGLQFVNVARAEFLFGQDWFPTGDPLLLYAEEQRYAVFESHGTSDGATVAPNILLPLLLSD